MNEHSKPSQKNGAGAAMESAEQAMAAWARAWGESAHGIMAAGLEQLELTRSLQGQAFELLSTWPGASQDLSQEWLRLVRPTFESAVAGYRRMNDELAQSLFSAAEVLTSGLGRDGQQGRPATPAAE